MRGAGWTRVGYVGPRADGWAWVRCAEWVTVYHAWNGVRPEGPGRDGLRGAAKRQSSGVAGR